ncbi:hypothetical protein CCACVL1_24327 [Corchorus capsularis]|uniref:BHLH domain-containing protein n=1 Tax=Corchorus capsularis TaxID=210143 RepID=A0A1R3GQ32_COCAP|nr:hypothetical protein CCACVL1_24327 [Corchorus capsularis]
MERDFSSSFGSNAANSCNFSPSFITDFNNINYSPEPTFNFNFNPIFNDPNLQTLLPLSSDPSMFNFFGQPQDFPSLPLQVEPPHLHPLYSASLLPDPQIPDSDPLPDSTQFLDFFSKPLPDLHSLEQPRPSPSRRHPQPKPRLFDSSSSASSARKLKRSRFDLNVVSHNDPQTLDSIVQSFNAPPPPPRVLPPRTGRQKLSDKIRCLQKLMPWDKKMDTVTMLEEASKYVRFLQAQVSVLQSMPITSSFGPTEQNAPVPLDYGVLGRLNRQQLLQVLLNSPAAQTTLSSQANCVFAYEQLVSLKKATERQTVVQQFLFGD